jgi:hypothetical protein
MKQLICFLCWLFVSTLDGKTFSIMHPEYNQTQDTSSITLNGIVFASPEQWVVWINHQRITPNRSPAWLKINTVTETSIDCDYLYKGLWYHVILEPYDSFTPTPKATDTRQQSPDNTDTTAS